ARLQSAGEDVQHVLHAGLAVRRHAPEVRPTDHDGLRAQGDGLEHIATAPDAAVHHHLDLVSHRVHHGGQDTDGGGRAVEVVAAVVGDGDGAGPGIDSTAGIVDPGDPLDHERPAPLLPQPGEVLPGGLWTLH